MTDTKKDRCARCLAEIGQPHTVYCLLLGDVTQDDIGHRRMEAVDHPDHYNANPSGVEAIDVIEHMSFNVGNAVKYLWRADHKGAPIEDLRKAEWYILREIKRRTRKPKE